jgi:hypothetical protein
MGIESREVNDLANDSEPVEAFLGGRRNRKKDLPYPEETEFRVFIGCLDDDSTRERYEALLTQSFRCQNTLENPGDLAVLTIQGTFDKEGCYHVVARYAILPEGRKTCKNK